MAFTGAAALLSASRLALVRAGTDTAPAIRTPRPAGALKTPRDLSVATYFPTIAPPGFAAAITVPGVVFVGSLMVTGG